MESAIASILSNINFMYIFMCNLVTYLILSSFSKDLKTWQKRLIATFVAGFIGLAMLIIEMETPHICAQIFYGFFIQFFTWDYVWKYVVQGITNFIKEKFKIKDTEKSEDKK